MTLDGMFVLTIQVRRQPKKRAMMSNDLIERLKKGPLYDFDGYKAYKLMQEAVKALEAKDQRIAELESALMTESEKRNLLSKEHYQERIEQLEAALNGVIADAEMLLQNRDTVTGDKLTPLSARTITLDIQNIAEQALGEKE